MKEEPGTVMIADVVEGAPQVTHVPYRHNVVCRCLMERTVHPLEASGLVPYQDMRLGTFETERVGDTEWRHIQAWIAGLPASVDQPRTPGAVFCGLNGRGKTHLAAALAHLARERGARVRFLREVDLLNQVQAGYDEGAVVKAPEVIRRLSVIPLLVVDDLGMGQVSNAGRSQEDGTWYTRLIYQLLDERLVQNRSTLLTTNVRKSDWPARWGAATASRLNMLMHVYVEGTDLR